MFNTAQFEQKLDTSWLGRSFLYFKKIDSTNRYAKAVEIGEFTQGTVILADIQLAGKGQYQKTWISQPNKNLTFSIIFIPPKPGRLTLLTLACASAVYDLLENVGVKKIKLKWPNDVLVDGKKVSGLLTECIYSGSSLEKVVVGIGLNVNQTKFEDEISDTATSLLKIIGTSFSREEILVELLSRIEHNYRRWVQEDVEMIKEINTKLDGYGKWVSLNVDGKSQLYKSKFLGINNNGALQALNKDLELEAYSFQQVKIVF